MPDPRETVEGVVAELERRAEKKVDIRDERRGKDNSLAGEKTLANIDGEAYGLRAAASLLRQALDQHPVEGGGWHYGAIKMGRRWFATRFHPGGPDNDGDLPDVGDTEFWEAGEWKPYSIAELQRRSTQHPPERGGDEDWPEVVLSRPTPEADPENWCVFAADFPPMEDETRRYVPANHKGEGPKYPPAERLVESLRWAINFIDDPKRRRGKAFDPDEMPSGDNQDWIEWASAHDWLKDVELATQPHQQADQDSVDAFVERLLGDDAVDAVEACYEAQPPGLPDGFFRQLVQAAIDTARKTKGEDR